MKDAEQELRRRMKEEADEILFGDLQFDSRLQEEVLRDVSLEHEQKQDKLRFRKWLRSRGKLWVYGSAAIAAVVLGLVLVSSSLFNHGTTDTNLPAPLLATGDVWATPTPNVESRMLQTPEEAKKLFGDGLRVPSYVPDKVKPVGIDASGIRNDEAAKVVFHYMFGDIAYSVIEEKNALWGEFHGFDQIDVNGNPGYLKSGETDTELHWLEGGVQYTVIGAISGTEAVKVAESMK